MLASTSQPAKVMENVYQSFLTLFYNKHIVILTLFRKRSAVNLRSTSEYLVNIQAKGRSREKSEVTEEGRRGERGEGEVYHIPVAQGADPKQQRATSFSWGNLAAQWVPSQQSPVFTGRWLPRERGAPWHFWKCADGTGRPSHGESLPPL